MQAGKTLARHTVPPVILASPQVKELIRRMAVPTDMRWSADIAEEG